MRTVYVSSTYKDLVGLRERVITAIGMVPGHQARAMENYSADSRTPLERCLADVRDSDVYVGLIGWRSGFVPPGEAHAITRLEYEAAFSERRPCLFFLTGPEERELAADASDDLERVAAFRALVRERHVCKLLDDSASRLDAYVMQSLFEEALRAWGTGLTDDDELRQTHLLPFVCDRQPQRQAMSLALFPPEPTADAPVDQAAPTAPPAEVPICVLHGVPEQMPDKFDEWLREELFAELAQEQEVSVLAMEWPLPQPGGEGQFQQLLTLSLAQAAQLQARSRLQLIKQLAARPTRYYVSVQLSLDHWQDDEHQRLASLRRFFRSWDGATGNAVPLAVLLWVTYKRPPPRRFWQLGRREGEVPENARVRRVLEQLAADPVGIAVLAELADAVPDDARKWARRPDVAQLTLGRDLISEVDGIFEPLESKALPMKPLAEALARVLKRSSPGG